MPAPIRFDGPALVRSWEAAREAAKGALQALRPDRISAAIAPPPGEETSEQHDQTLTMRTAALAAVMLRELSKLTLQAMADDLTLEHGPKGREPLDQMSTDIEKHADNYRETFRRHVKEQMEKDEPKAAPPMFPDAETIHAIGPLVSPDLCGFLDAPPDGGGLAGMLKKMATELGLKPSADLDTVLAETFGEIPDGLDGDLDTEGEPLPPDSTPPITANPNPNPTHKMATQNAAIIRHDLKTIAVPDGMSLHRARILLKRQEESEEERTTLVRHFDAHPLDVARALGRVIRRIYGIATGSGGTTIDAPSPDDQNATEHIPWESLAFGPLDASEGEAMGPDHRMERGLPLGQISAIVRRKHLPAVTEIADLVAAELLSDSLYRGRAVSLACAPSGEVQPTLALPYVRTGTEPTDALFTPELQQQLDAELYAPVRYRAALGSTPFGRGVLLSGPYGCGKSLTAAALATVAEQHQVTYVHLEDARAWDAGLRFAEAYAPAVLFLEDIDRLTPDTHSRTPELDRLSCALDGLGSKTRQVMVVATTNHPDRIHPVLRRPGRLDSIVTIDAPDAETAALLLSRFAGLPPEDCIPAGRILAGHIPARLREAAERAHLHALALSEGASALTDADALASAAQAVANEANIGHANPEPTVGERLAAALGDAIIDPVAETLGRTRMDCYGENFAVEKEAR